MVEVRTNENITFRLYCVYVLSVLKSTEYLCDFGELLLDLRKCAHTKKTHLWLFGVLLAHWWVAHVGSKGLLGFIPL